MRARPRGRARLRPQATARLYFPLSRVTTLVVIKIIIPNQNNNNKTNTIRNNKKNKTNKNDNL